LLVFYSKIALLALLALTARLINRVLGLVLRRLLLFLNFYRLSLQLLLIFLLELLEVYFYLLILHKTLAKLLYVSELILYL